MVCTLLGLLLVVGVWKGFACCLASVRGLSDGWEVVAGQGELRQEGRMIGRPWRRRRRLSRRILKWWRVWIGREVGAVDERRRLLDDS